MIHGFAINNGGSSKFGVVVAHSEVEAKRNISASTGVAADAINILDAEEVMSQFDEVAFLSPAEM